jgi:tRNA G10  N-methylase Trm11
MYHILTLFRDVVNDAGRTAITAFNVMGSNREEHWRAYIKSVREITEYCHEQITATLKIYGSSEKSLDHHFNNLKQLIADTMY